MPVLTNSAVSQAEGKAPRRKASLPSAKLWNQYEQVQILILLPSFLSFWKTCTQFLRVHCIYEVQIFWEYKTHTSSRRSLEQRDEDKWSNCRERIQMRNILRTQKVLKRQERGSIRSKASICWPLSLFVKLHHLPNIFSPASAPTLITFWRQISQLAMYLRTYSGQLESTPTCSFLSEELVSNWNYCHLWG